MEVLRSHDILEKQILEDARKKAKRILDNAKKECEKWRQGWNRPMEKMIGKKYKIEANIHPKKKKKRKGNCSYFLDLRL